MTPFIIRREKFGEVALLVNRINEREDTASGGASSVTYDEDGNKHIWRQAGDDFHL